jgi:hypothetical protein
VIPNSEGSLLPMLILEKFKYENFFKMKNKPGQAPIANFIPICPMSSKKRTSKSCEAIPLKWSQRTVFMVRLFVMTYLGFGANEAMARHHRNLFLGQCFKFDNFEINLNLVYISVVDPDPHGSETRGSGSGSESKTG